MNEDKRKLAEIVVVSFLAGVSVATIGWWRQVKIAGNISEMLRVNGMKLDVFKEALRRIVEEEVDLDELQKWFHEQAAFIDIIEESI